MKALFPTTLVLLCLAPVTAARPGAEAKTVAPSDNELCSDLAIQARKLPASAWANGGSKGLASWLKLEKPNPEPTGGAARIAQLPEVKEAIGNEDGHWTVFTEQLAGSDVYMATTIQGTLDCQNSVFVKAVAGQTARVIDPPTQDDGTGLCWTQSGDFGQPLGRPAYIKHGAISQETVDEDIDIKPWTGIGWGAQCRLALRFRTTYPRTERHCDDAAVCKAADPIVDAVAEAYNHAPGDDRQTGKFIYGPKPSASALAMVGSVAGDRKSSAETPAFPDGSGAPGNGFSYSGFALFPLTLNGQNYVAGIGHGGVGWRESGATLLAVYAVAGATLKPLAGYAFERKITGLTSAVATRRPPAEAR